jgi:ribosome-associated heat shock protein Hsp15
VSRVTASGHPSGPATRDDARIDAVRVDLWLWAVRLYKTRANAAAACRGGHVTVNGRPAKAATPVRIGDRVEADTERQLRIVEVARAIDKRVGAPIAAECFVDHSPRPRPRDPAFGRRDPGSGRPTKRDRRQIDRLRGR